MDATGLIVRHRMSLDQNLIDSLPLEGNSAVPGPRIPVDVPLVFAATHVGLARAEIRGYDVVIIADELHDTTSQEVPVSLELRRRSAAPSEQPGLPGHALTVLCRTLSSGRAFSHGGKGGRGRKGAPATEPPFDPIPHPDEDDGPDGPGPPFDPDEPLIGGVGLQGALGGLGGRVHVRYVGDQSEGNHLFDGPAGEGGKGGAGGPGIPDNEFTQGPEGPEGGLGTQLEAVLEPVSEETLRLAIAAVLGPERAARWAAFRAMQADAYQRNRTGISLALALEEAAAAEVLAPGQPDAQALTAALHDGRDELGLELDLELVPDETYHRNRHRAAAGALDGALYGSAQSLLGAITPARLENAADGLRARLGALLAPGGDLTLQGSEASTRASDAAAIRDDAPALIRECGDLIDARLGPLGPAERLLGVAGVTRDAGSVARALVDVVGPGEDGQGPAPGGLLPADVDLLVAAENAETGGVFLPGEEPLVSLKGDALGVAAVEEWNGIVAPASQTAIDLRQVADELRGATGSAGVPALLVELTELVHRWRLAGLRTTQALAAEAAVPVRRARAQAALDSLPADNVPIASDPPSVNRAAASILHGLRAAADGVRWFAVQEDRALRLYTLGYARHPESSADLRHLFFAADLAPEIEEGGRWDPEGLAIHDRILRHNFARDTEPLYTAFRTRGTQLAPPFPMRRTFERDTHPEVFERFITSGNLWIDATLVNDTEDDHFEAKVVGVAMNLYDALPATGDPASGAFGLDVTHFGMSRQRALDGSEHRHTALPADADVQMSFEVPGAPGTYFDRFCSGTTLAVAPKHNFKLYGRGAAAAYFVRLRDPSAVNLDELSKIEIEVLYDAFGVTGVASLLRVEHPRAALRPGAVASGRAVLTAPAPAAGLRLTLRSSAPEILRVRGSVDVPAGADAVTFPIEVLGATGAVPPALTASTPDGVTRRALVHVPPPAAGAPLVSRRELASAGAIMGIAQADGRVFAGVSGPAFLPAPPDRPHHVHALGLDLAPGPSVAAGEHLRSLAVDRGRNRLYVVNGGGSSSVASVDLTTLAPVGEHALGFGAIDVAVDPAAGLVYVSRQQGIQSGHLHVLTADLVPVEALTAPDGFNGVLGIAPDGEGRVYVARGFRSGTPQLAALSVVVRGANGSHAVEATVDLGTPAVQPVDVAVDAPAGLVFVACLGGPGNPPRVIVLEKASLAVRGFVPTRSNARAVAARPGTGIAYVAGEAGLMLVDGRALTLGVTIPAGHWPTSVAVDPATGVAYLGDLQKGTVTRIAAPADLAPAPWR